MQFAGQRTDEQLNPIGDPYNIFVRLSQDILPDPGAIMVTGITPQDTQQEGITEPEFARMLMTEIFTPGTTAVGFNNVRFDDEFIRHTLWRNFYDPYEWAWSEGRSRWDILDLVRMTRALRPEGITWPVDDEGRAVNKLELLSSVNGLDHEKAHDALSDVEATISVARLIREKQSKLFEYLLKLRDKKEIAKLINLDDPKPFVYSSGRYGRVNNFTTIAYPIAPGARPGTVLVYDLRTDPSLLKDLNVKDIESRLYAKREERQKDDFVPIPVKELAYNKCPATAPIGVIDDKAWVNIDLTLEQVTRHLQSLEQDMVDKISAVFAQKKPFPKESDVEGQLYDGFMNDKDKGRMEVIRTSSEQQLADFHPDFIDERLPELLFRYKARWAPKSLSEDEQEKWELYVRNKLQVRVPGYIKDLQTVVVNAPNDKKVSFLAEELRLWLETIIPVDD